MHAWAQEFPRDSVVGYLELHSGLSTNFQGKIPDLYAGGLDFRPQWVIIDRSVRLGATAGLLFTDTHLDAIIGPSLAWRLFNFHIPEFGTLGNFQLQLDYYWSTRNRQFLGGGPKIEIGRMLIVGLTVHRDFTDNVWLFQTTVGFNLFHTKPPNSDARPRNIIH